MDELIFSGELLQENESSPFYVATISEIDATGATLIFNAGMEATQKRYKHIDTGFSLTSGDRVLVAKVSGSYVIIGKIGL